MAMKPTEAPAGYVGDPALRPTSPPPPRKTGAIDPLESAYAMIRDLRAAVKAGDDWRDGLRKINDDLCKEIGYLRTKLAKHQCPDCGETDRQLKRILDPMSGEPVCSECGGGWE
jgi:predicted RNA-binding Zn-ribbon protein involved in translation (DUF1610 family)